MENSSPAREKSLSLRFAFREGGILFALLVLIAALAVYAPRFLERENLFNVLRQFSFIAIIAIGETFVVTIAGIDLSVGAVAGLSGIVCCAAIAGGTSVALGVGIGIFVGLACGLLNGLGVAYLRLPSFIVTLAFMSLARGFVYVITQGNPIVNLNPSFFVLGQGSVGTIPIPVLVMILLGIAGYLLLDRTPFGRKVAALGGNEQVALLTGLRINRIKISVFAISGFCAAVAGILLASRLNSGQPTLANGYELDAIAAVVIGGTSLFGGEGSIAGTLLGAAMMGIVRNGLILLNVSAYWQSVAIGAVILVACSLDRARGLIGFERIVAWTNRSVWRRVWVLAGLLCITVAAFAYSIHSKNLTTANRAGTRKPTIAVVPKLIHPYFELAKRGAMSEGKRLGIDVIWQAPINSDPAYQAQIIEDLLTKRVDAIAVAPVDDKVLLPFLAKAREAHIPVLTWDVDSSDKGDRIAYVGTDNYAAGKLAGMNTKQVMADSNDRVEYAVMTGSLGALNLNQRMAGFEDALRDDAKFARVALEANDDNADTALAQAETVLKAHPNLKLIFCTTGTATPQVAKAVREANLGSQVTIVGFDALDDTLQAVREGSVRFIVAQKPYRMGELAVRYLDDYLQGRPVPKETDTGATIVTRSNVENYQ
jgi:ribose/xylose/arabinose/galactoside ABC-type transport system permease subunit/ABC-type sugar transport system substrate-binding protein